MPTTHDPTAAGADALAPPDSGAPYWRWQTSPAEGGVEVRFLGRGPARSPAAALASCEEPPPRVAWLRQVHSAAALPAVAGACGEGDALHTGERRLALAIATADCVPVLLAAEGRVAAAHAGWRGLVAGILPAAVAALGRPAAGLRAWIGPAIGPCCYEVGEEVAAAVAAASDAAVVVPRTPRPHLDLQRAARLQLERAGVGAITTIARCTRCHPEELWSYRRDGRGAGRNLSFVWLR